MNVRREGLRLGRKIVAVTVILLLAYILFKLVIGMVMVAVWVILAILCLLGILWLAEKF